MKTIEVFDKGKTGRDRSAKEAIAALGFDVAISVSDVYYVDGEFDEKKLTMLAEELFTDELTQRYALAPAAHTGWTAEVRYMDTVSDPAESSIVQAISDLGTNAKAVRTAQRYYLSGKLSQKDVQRICKEALANDIVQQYYYGEGELEFVSPKLVSLHGSGDVREISLLDASDEKLVQISKDGLLVLSLAEMRAVKMHFAKEGRNPTDAELETIAQTWSEHCKHKTFSSEIGLTENGKKRVIGNLFKETIVAATDVVAKKKNWLISVFKDNAGIIKIDDSVNFAFKVETHNHPSALDPYGGASTGVGGVIRDVLGAGLGAKPIFNTDVFCFAPPDTTEVPEGILHPARIFRGVVSGVRDYGNRMGIPTVNGALVFHDSYLGAPLVYCGTGGILPPGKEQKKVHAGELIVVLGGRTGRDGLHGSTFSSAVLDEDSDRSAVQIGNPIEEKRVLDALMQARDLELYTCITDCGAGGFSSAVGEMGEETGAAVELDKVPLKYAGMQPWEIWLSESQERMVLSVPKKNLDALSAICTTEGVEMTIIGTFTNTKRLVVTHKGTSVANLDMQFLHHGLPKLKREAVWNEQEEKNVQGMDKDDYTDDLLRILSMPSVASKEEVIRRYDHEVQGNTIGKPLVGPMNDGPSDAAVIRVGGKAIAVANGINPRYSGISSYWMAALAIDEAMRNIVAAGGNPAYTALLDNFCWGNVAQKEKLGSLVKAAEACRDIAVAYEAPFISGKDSLHNEFRIGGKTIAILDTLLISAVSVMDVKDSVSMDVKHEGSGVYIVGKTYDEMGGSHHYEANGIAGGIVPKVRAAVAKKNMEQLHNAIVTGLVASCHDCSEGGIAIAAAEMAFAGGIGINLDIDAVPADTDRKDALLFSESASRFIVEVKNGKEKEFENTVQNAVRIGVTTAEKQLVIGSVVDASLDTLKNAWKGTIQW